MKTELTRPLVRYHGGKWRLADWIIGFFPAHRVYIEPFGGGGSVLLQKARCYAEIYNDLDAEIVNLFEVARDYGSELKRRCYLTPFSRVDFNLSYEVSRDPIEQARRTLVRSFMGFGSASVSGQKSGFRANSNRSGTTPAHDWANYPDALDAIVERLRGVVIEQRDAVDCIAAHACEDALIYVDPPYVHSTRYLKNKTRCYRHEMDDAAHTALAECLNALDCSVVLSGYTCELYDADLYQGWHRFERAAFADGAKARTEVIWLNAVCFEALQKERSQMGLFA